MSKGQRNHARQPVARVKGRETSQARQPGTGGVQPRGKTQGGMIKNRNGQPAEASARQGQARANGGKGRAPQNGRAARDAYGNPLMHEGTPLFKLSRREQEQQQMQQAQGRNKPVYQRDSNGDVNGNVALDHERRFGNKNAATPAGQPAAGKNGGQPRQGKPEGGKPQLVQKAKKLRLRSPNQDIKDKAKRLREVRVPGRYRAGAAAEALAASGVGSRREMEEWIEAGQVTVNGKKASLGDRVGPRDRVMVRATRSS